MKSVILERWLFTCPFPTSASDSKIHYSLDSFEGIDLFFVYFYVILGSQKCHKYRKLGFEKIHKF